MLARWPFGGGCRCRCWRSAPEPSSWGAAPAWFALLGPAPAASCKRQSTLVQQASGTACCLAGCRGTAGPCARHLMREAVRTHVTASFVEPPEGGKAAPPFAEDSAQECHGKALEVCLLPSRSPGASCRRGMSGGSHGIASLHCGGSPISSLPQAGQLQCGSHMLPVPPWRCIRSHAEAAAQTLLTVKACSTAFPTAWCQSGQHRTGAASAYRPRCFSTSLVLLRYIAAGHAGTSSRPEGGRRADLGAIGLDGIDPWRLLVHP